jgi:hypothetical protein
MLNFGVLIVRLICFLYCFFYHKILKIKFLSYTFMEILKQYFFDWDIFTHQILAYRDPYTIQYRDS